MAISNIKASFQCDIQKVWDTVSSLENYSWRSDLSRIEIINPTKFVEYTKDGYSTVFEITAFEPMTRYEFDMDNDNMCGHWTGIFSFDGTQTHLDFTENVTAKKLIMKPFVKLFLKKQQANYMRDLSRALELKK